MLTIKSLGKFEMSDGTHLLNDEVLRSDMIKKLLIYILTHREHPVTVQELSEALWQEGEVDNPAGALKNLMYRLRNLLKNVLGDETYIITSQGAYAWNRDIEVDFDIELFEKYYKQAKSATEKDVITRCYESAFSLYRGEFMESAFEHHWVVTLTTYYHSLFLNVVKSLAELYMEAGRYQDLEDISVYALSVDGVDEELYYWHIMALVKENKYDLALKSYEEAERILEDSLGVRNSEKLREVQREILKMRKGNEAESLENIYEDMQEADAADGVYFCGYPIFREIYRLKVRNNARVGETEYIILFSVRLSENVKTDNAKMAQFLIEQGMKNLKNAIKQGLRVGDMAARYSESQFIVLLPSCNYESSVAVAKRVLDKFEVMDKGKKIKIKTEFEKISNANSQLVK